MVGEIAVRAMELFAERFPAPALLGRVKVHPPLAEMKGLFQGVRDSFFRLRTVGEAINYHLQFFFFLIQLFHFLQVSHALAVQ